MDHSHPPELQDSGREEDFPGDSANIRLFINQTVVSEYFFQCLKADSNKAPLTLKEQGKIPQIINPEHSELLNLFGWLEDGPYLTEMVPGFMQKYNLLPNDAIIVSLCKANNIKAIASFDTNDFVKPCQEEGIVLIRSLDDFDVFRSVLQ